jgi:uncharacterized protein YjbJ (UPF0337 family)
MITPAVTPRANTWAPTESQMDQDRVTGTSKTVGGKIEVGRMTGNAQTQLEGSAKQVAGAAEDLYGQAKDAAASFTDIVQRTIERQPYTAVAVALAIGWLLGRTHRPI